MAEIVLRNRNWGGCYVSDGEAGLLIAETVLEIIVLLFLLVFVRTVWGKMREFQTTVDFKSLLWE